MRGINWVGGTYDHHGCVFKWDFSFLIFFSYRNPQCAVYKIHFVDTGDVELTVAVRRHIQQLVGIFYTVHIPPSFVNVFRKTLPVYHRRI